MLVEKGDNTYTWTDVEGVDINLENSQEITDFLDYLEGYAKSRGASSEDIALISNIRDNLSTQNSHIFYTADIEHKSGFENFLKQKYH